MSWEIFFISDFSLPVLENPTRDRKIYAVSLAIIKLSKPNKNSNLLQDKRFMSISETFIQQNNLKFVLTLPD